MKIENIELLGCGSSSDDTLREHIALYNKKSPNYKFLAKPKPMKTSLIRQKKLHQISEKTPPIEKDMGINRVSKRGELIDNDMKLSLRAHYVRRQGDNMEGIVFFGRSFDRMAKVITIRLNKPDALDVQS